MTARENFPEPRMMEVVTVKPNKPIIGKAFKAKAKEVQSALEELDEEAALCLQVRTSLGSTPAVSVSKILDLIIILRCYEL